MQRRRHPPQVVTDTADKSYPVVRLLLSCIRSASCIKSTALNRIVEAKIFRCSSMSSNGFFYQSPMRLILEGLPATLGPKCTTACARLQG